MVKKRVVLVGGCFDVLHPGHVIFLEKAKRLGDRLVVLLESDERVNKLKGHHRPVYTQKLRAKMLSALKAVDQVISLPFMQIDAQYDQLIAKLHPDIIAVTDGYANVKHHKRVADKVGAKLKYVTGVVGNHSSTRLLKEILV